MYKRNGYYYIFAPAGGVKPGWQTVLRSKNIYGPYEEKIVLHQGNTPVNGPHQGAWVDTPDGQDFFLHFQDVGNAGRIIHLQPMYWENDWPVIGVNPVDGCGEPVLRYKKPVQIEGVTPDAPEDSDTFEEEKLGLQWQWNANYKEDWYKVGGGSLTLYAQPKEKETQLCDVSNLLLQKWPAPEFMITTCLHLDKLAENSLAGMISLGGCYTALAAARRQGKLLLVQRTGNWEQADETETVCREITAETIYLRMKVEKSEDVSFLVSGDGVTYEPIGETVQATPGRWVGVKTGLFAVTEGEKAQGSLTADYYFYDAL